MHWVVKEKKVFAKHMVSLAKLCSMAIEGGDFPYPSLHICSIVLFSEMRLQLQ